MPIESKLKLKGFSSPIAGVFTRIVGVEIDTQTGQTTLLLRDWSSKEAARKILQTKEVPIPDPPYDAKNPLHKSQWEAAGKPSLTALDAHGQKWRPTLGLTESVTFWAGRTAEEPIQERRLALSPELALAVAAQSMEGATPRPPANALEAMTAQLYLAAMQTGEFDGPEAVSGLPPSIKGED